LDGEPFSKRYGYFKTLHPDYNLIRADVHFDPGFLDHEYFLRTELSLNVGLNEFIPNVYFWETMIEEGEMTVVLWYHLKDVSQSGITQISQNDLMNHEMEASQHQNWKKYQSYGSCLISITKEPDEIEKVNDAVISKFNFKPEDFNKDRHPSYIIVDGGSSCSWAALQKPHWTLVGLSPKSIKVTALYQNPEAQKRIDAVSTVMNLKYQGHNIISHLSYSENYIDANCVVRKNLPNKAREMIVEHFEGSGVKYEITESTSDKNWGDD